MKLYSNVLTAADLQNTIRQVPGMYIDELQTIKSPKLRQKGWNIVTAGNSNRWKNSGTYGAKHVNAATYDDHGHWFARLYAIDPNALIVGAGRYESADDFHKKTGNKYKPTAA